MKIYKLRPVYQCDYSKCIQGMISRNLPPVGESSLKKTPSFWMLLKDGKLIDTFLKKATLKKLYPHIKVEII